MTSSKEWKFVMAKLEKLDALEEKVQELTAVELQLISGNSQGQIDIAAKPRINICQTHTDPLMLVNSTVVQGDALLVGKLGNALLSESTTDKHRELDKAKTLRVIGSGGNLGSVVTEPRPEPFQVPGSGNTSFALDNKKNVDSNYIKILDPFSPSLRVSLVRLPQNYQLNLKPAVIDNVAVLEKKDSSEFSNPKTFCTSGFSIGRRISTNDTCESTTNKRSAHQKLCSVKGNQCQLCGKFVVRLDKHMRIHHTDPGAKPYSCTICSKTFALSSQRNAHMRYHTGEGLHVCSVCSKAFLNQSKLERHFMVVHARKRPHSCNVCGKTFSTSYHLSRHEKGVHRMASPLVCKMCGKRYLGSSEFKIHITSHTPLLSCTFCLKSFSRRDRLCDHIRTHTGEKPFRCKICLMEFSTSTRLSTHFKINHKTN